MSDLKYVSTKPLEEFEVVKKTRTSGDLISRDDAINKCQARLYESALNNVGIECKADEVFSDIAQNRIKNWLEELPSAERKGHWVEGQTAGQRFVKCSRCGHIEFDGTPNYCEDCGARMVSEDD